MRTCVVTDSSGGKGVCKCRVCRADGHCWSYLNYWEPSLSEVDEGEHKKLEVTVAELSPVAGHHSPLFNKAHDCPARDYISQAPLKVGVATWLFCSHWDERGSDVWTFRIMVLKKHSSASMGWNVGMVLATDHWPQTRWLQRMVEEQDRRHLSPQMTS